MTKRIRVLRIIARLNVGGPAVHATLLTERLDPDRYESFLVAGTEEPWEGNYLQLRQKSIDGLLVVPALGRPIRAVQDLAALRELTRLVRRLRPDVVHTHTAKAGALGRLAARLARVPIVVHTYHGHVFHGYFPRAKTRLFLAIDRWLARRTDRLLAVSDTVRRELLALGIGRADRFSVMPLGLDMAELIDADSRSGRLRAELGLGDDAPLVGIVGRLAPIKAHEIFLQAAAFLAQRVPDCRFVVVGDGERRAELAALTERLGLAGRVRFLGWRVDLDRIYADLDVVALTSRAEGSPASLLEAMAAGRVVVATRVGGVPDIVEDGVTGVLVPAGEPERVAAAITTVLDDPARRRRVGEAARKRVYPAFSAERLLADMDRLYTSLLDGRNGAAQRR